MGVLPRHYHTTLKMNGRLLIALAVGAVLLHFAECTIILLTGTTTAVTVSGAALVAGAAAVGALALGAAAAIGLAKRGKREAATCLPFSNPEVYFNMAANADFHDCGRRFVCELEATADDKLSQEEILIRNLFGRPNGATAGIAGGYFAEAGAIGAINGVAVCAETFSTCPFDRKAIYLAFLELQKAQ